MPIVLLAQHYSGIEVTALKATKREKKKKKLTTD